MLKIVSKVLRTKCTDTITPTVPKAALSEATRHGLSSHVRSSCIRRVSRRADATEVRFQCVIGSRAYSVHQRSAGPHVFLLCYIVSTEPRDSPQGGRHLNTLSLGCGRQRLNEGIQVRQEGLRSRLQVPRSHQRARARLEVDTRQACRILGNFVQFLMEVKTEMREFRNTCTNTNFKDDNFRSREGLKDTNAMGH